MMPDDVSAAPVCRFPSPVVILTTPPVIAPEAFDVMLALALESVRAFAPAFSAALMLISPAPLVRFVAPVAVMLPPIVMTPPPDVMVNAPEPSVAEVEILPPPLSKDTAPVVALAPEIEIVPPPESTLSWPVVPDKPASVTAPPTLVTVKLFPPIVCVPARLIAPVPDSSVTLSAHVRAFAVSVTVDVARPRTTLLHPSTMRFRSAALKFNVPAPPASPMVSASLA